MAITPEQIDNWRSVPSELERLEFKEAKLQYDSQKLLQYCVAIANEGGGHLILGVANDPPRPVVGTQACRDVVGLCKQIYDKLHFRIVIEEVSHPNGRVVVFQIPSRPRGTAYHLDGTYLMRCGDALVPMSEDHLREIFSEGKQHWLEEHCKTGLDSQQVINLLDTQTFFELLKLPYPSDRSGVIERLQQVQFIDYVNGFYAIRRLGAILIAKKLDDFHELVRKAPRVIVYTGTSKMDTRVDIPGTKGYAVGFPGLVSVVSSLLPQNEIIEGTIRKSVKWISEDAIRELLANALIHQDFTIDGTSMMVEIYSNRIDISNPGEPVVPVERFIDGCRSRNERFAALMRRVGICEEKGSGIDRVITAAEIFQLPAPDFRAGHKSTYVTIYGPQKFEAMERDDRIRACYQHCALKYVVSERMTNQTLRKRFNLPVSKSAIVSQIIAQTIEEKWIKPDEKVGGSRKYARYLPFWA
jgi:predicted HTH transcriptional regulator